MIFKKTVRNWVARPDLRGVVSEARRATLSARERRVLRTMVCFALLRAENIEKDLQNPPETAGNHKTSPSRTPKISTFSFSEQYLFLVKTIHLQA